MIGLGLGLGQGMCELERVPARCRVKVAFHHTYITLPQVAPHIARLRTRLKLDQDQEDMTNYVRHFLKQILRDFRDPVVNIGIPFLHGMPVFT